MPLFIKEKHISDVTIKEMTSNKHKITIIAFFRLFLVLSFIM